MAEVRSTVVVDAAPDRLFAYLADPGNDPAWRSEVTGVEMSGGPEGAVGARYRQRLDLGGRAVELHIEVTGLEPPRRIAYDVSGPIAGTGAYLLAPADGGTQVEFRLAFRSPGLRRLADGAIAAAIERAAGANLETLRSLMEDGA